MAAGCLERALFDRTRLPDSRRILIFPCHDLSSSLPYYRTVMKISKLKCIKRTRIFACFFYAYIFGGSSPRLMMRSRALRRIEVCREEDQVRAAFPGGRRNKESLGFGLEGEPADGLGQRLASLVLLLAPRFVQHPAFRYAEDRSRGAVTQVKHPLDPCVQGDEDPRHHFGERESVVAAVPERFGYSRFDVKARIDRAEAGPRVLPTAGRFGPRTRHDVVLACIPR